MSYNLGKLLIKNKKFTKALNIFQNKLINNPNDLRANFQIGKIYYELNDLDKSIKFFQKCDEIQPNTPNVLFNLALALQSTGKVKDAKEKYLNLISINPMDVKSYYGLYTLDIKNITPELFKNLENLVQQNNISLYEKSLINFIFSKIKKKEKLIKDEIKFLDLSHKQCAEANLFLNNQSDFYYKKIISNHFNKIYFRDNFKSLTGFNDLNHLFIIGLPRSGSTLVETIITHNSNEIVSVGEFHAINTSILYQIGKTIFSKDFDSSNYKFEINKKIFQQDLIEKYGNFEKKIFLDKSLENFFNIEIILKFFPNSKFIHTYRDFKDVTIGIYQKMLPELSWVHNIKDIINYMSLYNKTIKYFKKKYPKKIIDVNLNQLTNNKKFEVKKILNFCEIEFKDNYLDFDRNEKLFNKTNSFLQVRNKIKNYEDKKYHPYYYLLDI